MLDSLALEIVRDVLMNREAQQELLATRAKTYDQAAMSSHDPAIIQGFRDAAINLLEHRHKMLAEPEYELPQRIRKELGIT